MALLIIDTCELQIGPVNHINNKIGIQSRRLVLKKTVFLRGRVR